MRLGGSLAAALAVVVPAIVLSSLDAMAAPADYRVACLTADGDVGRVRPGACAILGLGMGDAGYWSLRELRWTRWGTKSAVATGVSQSRPLTGGGARRLRVRVDLTRLVEGCDGRRWYSRARMETRFGVQRLRLPTCAGRRPGP